MSNIEIKKKIKKLLKQRDAIMLAHNYQRDEIQEIADITGDSLGLSIEAAKSKASVIVFCGVHFMAESASILNPEKTVILPNMKAGCPMADMITAEALIKKKKEFSDAAVVTYVNSSADVKAESDICCTSANAVRVVNSLKNAKKILFTPDKNLGRYVSKLCPDKEFILWEGFCPTHNRLNKDDVLKLKEKHKDALFIAHPECKEDVLEIADHICSTSGMYAYVKKSSFKKFIIGTEAGILFRLKKENRSKKFILASNVLICPNMKVTTLEDVLRSLENMDNIVKVPENTRIQAKKALDKMIAIPREN